MSYNVCPVSPKKIPIIHLSPKVRQKLNSPYYNRRGPLFINNAESFKNNPTINPITKRTIKIGGNTYKRLVKLFGEPYKNDLN